jgi:hypothetical protein
MAQEINFHASLTVSKGGLTVGASATKSVDMAGTDFEGTIQSIGTTTEAITFGDVTTPGYLFLLNTDPTNFVQIGLTSPVSAGNAIAKLLPGEFCFIPTRQSTIYALADTGAVELQKVLTEL